MKKILYVSRAGLPITAPGIRITQIGNLYELLGYKVHYICNVRINEQIENLGYEQLFLKDNEDLNSKEIHYFFNNKVYSYLPRFSGGKINAIKEIIELIFASREYKRIINYCQKEKPIAIVLYNDVFSLTKKLIKYCRKNNIKLLADVTEWYEKRRDATIAEKILIALTDKRIKKNDEMLDGIIAISKYFENYYKKKKVKCIWVPPLIDFNMNKLTVKHDYDKNQCINFIYAGSPGSKDILLPFINAMIKINKNKLRCKLELIGIDKLYLENYGLYNIEKYGIRAHGRVMHEEVLKYMKKADFGILLRKNERYAKAGFSTKFVECMGMGVPMICNKIGGTDLFVKNWENGILIDDYEEETIIKLLEVILQIDLEQLFKMKENAFNDAKKYFDAKNYINQLSSLLS